MPQYRYRARGAQGAAVEGVMEGTSSDVVAESLQRSQLIPVDIVLLEEKGADVMSSLREALLPRRVDLTEMIMLSRQMYTLLHAGVPIIRSIKGLVETTRNRALARALTDVAEQLESGRPLADCLRGHPEVFTSLYVNIIHVGENTGQLDESFRQIGDYLELEKETRDRIKSALRYPSFVLAAIVLAVGLINVLVIPAFAKVFESFDAELPWATRVLIASSDFSVAYWPHMVAAAALLVFAARTYVRTEAGRHLWDRHKLYLPLAGKIVRLATLGRYARSFAMALRSGVPLMEGLNTVAGAVDNAYVARRLLAMRGSIERGESLTATHMASGLFTPLVVQMIAVGEETGSIGELLDQVGRFYEREVDYDLKQLSASIEPIIVTLIGAIVLVLALGVFLPMWELGGAARGG